MTPRAKTYGPKGGGSYIARAQARWNGDMPDWVKALANAADASPSQTELAKRLGVVSSTISAIIGKTYPGNLAKAEARIRGVLMSEKVSCPVMGTIPRDACATNQTLEFSAANPQRAKLYRACRGGCPHSLLAKGA